MHTLAVYDANPSSPDGTKGCTGTVENDFAMAGLSTRDWVQSGGTQYPDWYKNLRGYRVESNVFVW
jgi:hypothetical protein